MQERNCPGGTKKSWVFYDAINENAERSNAGVSVHTIGPFNHKEPYKVTRVKHDAPKSHREPFKTTQTAVEILKDSKYAVLDGVRIKKETTVRDLVQESLIPVV